MLTLHISDGSSNEYPARTSEAVLTGNFHGTNPEYAIRHYRIAAGLRAVVRRIRFRTPFSRNSASTTGFRRVHTPSLRELETCTMHRHQLQAPGYVYPIRIPWWRRRCPKGTDTVPRNRTTITPPRARDIAVTHAALQTGIALRPRGTMKSVAARVWQGSQPLRHGPCARGLARGVVLSEIAVVPMTSGITVGERPGDVLDEVDLRPAGGAFSPAGTRRRERGCSGHA